MSRFMQRPENALKRANEFIEVGKPSRALDTLQEVFRSKKHMTYNWTESVIEPIMFKYLYLCVELKKSHIAKEGLFQYRNMFQLVNVGSLENVIRGYLKMAEKKTEDAQKESSQAVLDVDDLENFVTPESILMSAVCGEDAQDRSDRTILLPWVKFLWESYCQCLELLRVNSHCENLYHDIARMAFQFCLKYNRKSEFRRLCDKLRKHLEDICKNSNQSNVSITKLETQQLNLDTRLYQLDCAMQMELWQEAYKAIEDVHGLMTLSKKTPIPKTMATYYQKLAMVFWKAGNQLFHAAALLKLFHLTRELKKNLTRDEMQRMASHVLIATLSIPLPSAHPEFYRFIETDKTPMEKAQKLALLLGLPQPPTRASLIKEVLRLNVNLMASEDIGNLYNWLEIEFDPLNLCQRVKAVTDAIEEDDDNLLNQYTQSLKDVTIVRMIRQISQVYQSVEFTRLLELAVFCNIFELEKILVDSVRHNDMQIRIDHQKRCIHFGTDLTESQKEYTPDGPTLQSMPSEQIRSQLVNMSNVLKRAFEIVYPNMKKSERETMRSKMVLHYHAIKDNEHQRILTRQKIIEERKEMIEKMNIAREEEEIRRQEEANRQQKLAEQKRLEIENEERERKRQQTELQAIKDKSLKEKMQQISQTAHGKKMLSKLDEEGIKKLDAEQIAARETEELLKERKELQTKLKSQEKKIDYYERAKRMEEIPLIEKFLEEKLVQDKAFWEKQEAERIENAISERENAITQQDRLKRMHGDREAFIERIKTERASLFVDKLKRFEVELEEARKKRLANRVTQRREERRAKWLREKEEERLRKEEEKRREQEEEERKLAEIRRKEREIEDEKNRVIQEKIRMREEEAEKKIQEMNNKWSREVAAEEKKERSGRDGRDQRENRDQGREGGGVWRRPNEDGGSSWRTANQRGAETRAPPRENKPIQREEREPRGEPRDREREQPATGGSSWRDQPSARSSAAPSGQQREWRRAERNDDDRKIERGGDRDRNERSDRGPMRRGDDRDNRGGNRDNREGGGSDWRNAPKRDDDRENRRPQQDRRQGGNRDGGRDAGKQTTSSWRTAGDNQDKGRPQRGAEQGNDDGEGEWTDVKRR
ncbi:EIF3A family protein [Megaselia abdita]